MIKHRLFIMVIAVGFSLSGVYIPFWLYTKQYTPLIFSWVMIHLSGRVQQIILQPLYHRLKLSRISKQPTSLLWPLCSEVEKRKQAAKIHWQAKQVTTNEEVVWLQLVPHIVGVCARAHLLSVLLPEMPWSGVVGAGLMTLVVLATAWGFRLNKQRWQLEWQAYEAYWLQLINQRLAGGCQAKTGGGYPTGQGVMRVVLTQEALKLLVGGATVTLLFAGVYQASASLLPSLIWLGFADHAWGLLSAVLMIQPKETVRAIDESPFIQRNYQPVQREVDIRNVRLTGGGLVNFRIVLGEVIQITGKNGAGKTSLLKLLLGEPAQEGAILCDGIKRPLYLEDGVCVLGSSPVYCTGVLSDYLTDDVIMKAGIMQWVSSLPQKQHTEIREIHQRWSQGMIQHLNLAYAINQKAKIYILDEACVHLTIDQEILFYKKLLKHRSNVTIIYVSHQMSATNTQVSGQKATPIKQTS